MSMLNKFDSPVKLFVPLKALVSGFKGGLLNKTLFIFRDSFTANEESPSQAMNPILDPTTSTTFRLFNCIDMASGTACSPSYTLTWFKGRLLS